MKISIEQAKNIISTLVQAQFNGKFPTPVMLWGPPGVGKSAIINEIAKENELGVTDIRLAQMDPVDLRGIPTVENGVTKWAAPDFLPQNDASPAILFLDELSAADPSIQVAAYQLILDRRCDSYQLPDNVYICAAGNRAEDHAVAMPISSALSNRMMHLEIKPDSDAWCKWAVANKISPEVVGFIRVRPEMLFTLHEECEHGWPSPRSWAGVARTLDFGLGEDDLKVAVFGLVGEEAGVQFLAYRTHCQKLGDIHEVMLNNPKVWKLPTKLDMLYAVASSIAYWVWRGKDEEESRKLLDGFFRISLQLPPTFAVVAMTDAISGKDGEEHAKAFQAHPSFGNWQNRFSATMAQKRA